MPRSERTIKVLDRKATAYENEYKRIALRLFGKEREEVAEFVAAQALRGDVALQAALRFITEQYTSTNGAYHRDWIEAYVDLSARVTKVGGKDLAAETGFNFSLVNPHVVDAAVDRAATLAEYVGETSANRISEAVADALAEGTTDLAEVIREEAFDEDITLARAERIARTESIGALNEGEYRSAVASEVFAEKMWMTQGDDRVRESHADLDGVRIAIDEVFENGLMFPGDQSTGDASEVVNCRCTLLYFDSPEDTGGEE